MNVRLLKVADPSANVVVEPPASVGQVVPGGAPVGIVAASVTAVPAAGGGVKPTFTVNTGPAVVALAPTEALVGF